jgi:hypothetical protein
MVLYSTYMEIYNQLSPHRLFNLSAEEKEQINWVFLMLGQTLGLCIAPFFKVEGSPKSLPSDKRSNQATKEPGSITFESFSLSRFLSFFNFVGVLG